VHGEQIAARGASANLQGSFQTFPNFRLFSPSFSKESFGGFVGIQGVAVELQTERARFQIFRLLTALEEPSRAAKPVWIVEVT
jgi:hypothetical protein